LIIFLDANVILDFLDSLRPRHTIAKNLFLVIQKQDIKIMISEDMLTNIFYIYKDKVKALQFFQIIQYKWIISSFGNNVINQALNLSIQYNLDLEDILQCLCAKNNNCDVFITSDTNFHNCGIKIQTPQDFINENSNS
jgi:predicted nucleic acid-binding protein